MSPRDLRWRRSSRSPLCRSRRLVSFLDRANKFVVIARESGRSSIPERLRFNREAAAYWLPRLSRGMTAVNVGERCAQRPSNLLIVFADLGMSAQHGIHRLEHVAHALLADRAFDHHHQLGLVG